MERRDKTCVRDLLELELVGEVIAELITQLRRILQSGGWQVVI